MKLFAVLGKLHRPNQPPPPPAPVQRRMSREQLRKVSFTEVWNHSGEGWQKEQA